MKKTNRGSWLFSARLSCILFLHYHLSRTRIYRITNS